mgnify:CR=1 FL=1
MSPRFDTDQFVPLFRLRVSEGVHGTVNHDRANSRLQMSLDNFLDLFHIGVFCETLVVNNDVVALDPILILIDLG